MKRKKERKGKGIVCFPQKGKKEGKREELMVKIAPISYP